MAHKRSIVCDAEKFEFLVPYFYNKYLDEIDKDMIDFVVQEKKNKGVKKDKVSDATINRLLALIRSVLNKANKEWGWVDKVPFIKLKPEPKGRIRYLTKEEAHRLIKELPEHLKLLVQFSLLTGQRQANVLNIKWTDVDLERQIWTIKPGDFKQNKYHAVPLSNETCVLLRSIKKQHHDHIFTYKGERIKACNTRAFRNALHRAGISDFRWHDLRHTSASWLIQAGVSEYTIKEIFGWDDERMVKRYSHLAPTNLISAVDKISLTTEDEKEYEICT